MLLPPHHGLYREYSRRVNAIYEQYTDLVEPFGIDESWLDITGSMHLFGGDPKAIADTLRRRLRQELGLTISVGVSFNKVFAKLGSDYKSPMPLPSSAGKTGRISSGPCRWGSAVRGPGSRTGAAPVRCGDHRSAGGLLPRCWKRCWASWGFSSMSTPTGWTAAPSARRASKSR